jgi:hypothetical protein
MMVSGRVVATIKKVEGGRLKAEGAEGRSLPVACGDPDNELSGPPEFSRSWYFT